MPAAERRVKTRRGRPARAADRPTEEKCVICGEGGDERGPWSQVTSGIKNVINASKRRKDGKDAVLVSGAWLHRGCRADYVHEVNILKAIAASGDRERVLRSRIPDIEIKTHCILCGEPGRQERFKKDNKCALAKLCNVETNSDFEASIRAAIKKRGSDEWAQEVEERLDRVIVDLPAAEAKYHQDCSTRFRLGKQRGKPRQAVRARGRPSKGQKEAAGRRKGQRDMTKDGPFQHLVHIIQNSDECQYSFAELEAIVKSCNGTGYTRPWLKERLVEKFGEAVSITERSGPHGGLVNFTGFVGKLLYSNWYDEKKETEAEERLRIIEQAARFIAEDIRKTPQSMDFYPTPEKLLSHQLPASLDRFLGTLITSKAKSTEGVARRREALGQALMYCCRPKTFLPPILLGLAADLHHQEGCRDMIDIMNAFGMCVSYSEVRRFRKNIRKAAVDAPVEQPEEGDVMPFMQYVYDNADWNIDTLDGKGTFHVLGGIRVTTPAPCGPSAPVPRLPLSDDLAAAGGAYGIDVSWYTKPPVNGLSRIKVKKLQITAMMSPQQPAHFTAALCVDALWMTGRWLGVPRSPSWQGYMKQVLSVVGTFAGDVSGIDALPFIDMPPGNLTTLYSALLFAARDCAKRGQHHCFVTFDQPLYSKAVEIVASDTTGQLRGVTVRPGGFHLLMSFMGGMSYLMTGSGLEDLWAQVYAPNTVKNMMAGSQYSRALRAHFLAQEAVGTLLLEALSLDEDDKASLRGLHQALLDSGVTGEVPEDAVVKKLHSALEDAGNAAAHQSRTGKLWWQYFKLVGLVRLYVRAERTADWALHLECVKAMLPYFHAAGRLHYAKVAHLYVQQMEELQGSLADAAQAGLFTARRKPHPWAGVWTDMLIEQDLMRPLKVQGGLTRGRGLTQSVISEWVASLPSMLKWTTAMEELSGVRRVTSEQHKELRVSRQARDCADLDKLVVWIRRHSPFGPSDGIRCITTGERGRQNTNCDEAEQVGLTLVNQAVGKPFATLSLQRKARVIPLSTQEPAPKAGQDDDDINANMLFMRMCSLSATQEKLKHYLTYELASHPPALFDKGLMRHNTKSSLTRRLGCTNEAEEGLVDDPLSELSIGGGAPGASDPSYTEKRTVVDGGYLLHVVTWPGARGEVPAVTYGEVCAAYVRYVRNHFGDSAIVVFDGYDVAWSTKCEEQRRRAAATQTQRRPCPDIDFDEDTAVSVQREDFLSNTRNKAALIRLLKHHLRAADVGAVQADADADVVIVEAALRLDEPGRHVSVIATDTDIVVMLMARAEDHSNIVVVHPGNSGSAEKVFPIATLRREKGDMAEIALVAHAMSGCDTTSAIFRKGKQMLWKNLEGNAELRRVAREFLVPDADKDRIAECGEKLILSLYPKSKKYKNVTLNLLRYYEFHDKVQAKPSAVPKLSSFPPTCGAARQHSYRVYLQVQQWLGRSLSPTEWGWRATANTLEPVPSLLPAAPEDLTKLVFCNCKTGCRTGTNCSCRAADLPCSPACGNCRGERCTNAPGVLVDDDWDQ